VVVRLPRPLTGRRPKRKAKARHCLSCKVAIESWKWLCDPCFGILPYATKHSICEARAERAPHRVYGLSFEAAKNLIAKREQEIAK
jgi:hypothetical protein